MERQRTNIMQALATVVLGFMLVVAGSAISVALISTSNLSASGANAVGKINAVNFQVYWDRSCTNVADTLDWGSMEPNMTRNITIYVRNTGTVSEGLSMRTSNWNPTSAQNYIRLTWDCENKILKPAANITATFTLRIFPNVTNLADFSFDITITGAKHK